MRSVWILVILALQWPLFAMADEVEEETTSLATELLPHVGVLGRVGVGAVLGGDPVRVGQTDALRSGFHFERLDLAVDGAYGPYTRVNGRVLFREDGMWLDHATIGLASLPWNVALRAGLLRSRIGRHNELNPEEQTFVALPLVAGKMFGPMGHRAVGLDLYFAPPVSWQLGFFAAATSAEGVGQRSFFGEDPVEIEHPRDFIYQLGVENDWQRDQIHIGFDLHALLGPNNTGRANSTDIYGAAFTLGYDDGEGYRVGLNTEWYLRRRQVIADVLQDLGGFVTLSVGIAEDYGIAARYELTTGVDDDYLDPADTEKRHRASLQASWEPADSFRMRLVGGADFGGPLEDSVYSVLLHFEAGLTSCPGKFEEGRCTQED